MSKSNDLYADAQAGSKTAHYMALALKHKARTEQLEAINAELLEALEAALPFVDYVHHYDQRRMTAGESKSCKAAHKKMLYAIKHAKGD